MLPWKTTSTSQFYIIQLGFLSFVASSNQTWRGNSAFNGMIFQLAMFDETRPGIPGLGDFSSRQATLRPAVRFHCQVIFGTTGWSPPVMFVDWQSPLNIYIYIHIYIYAVVNGGTDKRSELGVSLKHIPDSMGSRLELFRVSQLQNRYIGVFSAVVIGL